MSQFKTHPCQIATTEFLNQPSSNEDWSKTWKQKWKKGKNLASVKLFLPHPPPLRPTPHLSLPPTEHVVLVLKETRCVTVCGEVYDRTSIFSILLLDSRDPVIPTPPLPNMQQAQEIATSAKVNILLSFSLMFRGVGEGSASHHFHHRYVRWPEFAQLPVGCMIARWLSFNAHSHMPVISGIMIVTMMMMMMMSRS